LTLRLSFVIYWDYLNRIRGHLKPREEDVMSVSEPPDRLVKVSSV
jgi:hypothetical protein